MRIFLTTYEEDGVEYAGPNIHALSWKMARRLAEFHGLTVSGILTDVVEEEVSFDDIVDDLQMAFTLQDFFYDVDTQYKTIH
jgi:hypothetical protein|tara:strand:+ start:846 stop:1091 length:246 start_codon:yes stop_codon:yes gene_type:complete